MFDTNGDDRTAVRRGYDELAGDYAAARDTDPSEATLLDRLDARLGPGARVLDAGCGDGRVVAARLAAHHSIVGLDISGEQVRRAARPRTTRDSFRGS